MTQNQEVIFLILIKAYQRLWMVRRLKQMGANDDELLDVYCKQIRSVLEYAAVVS